MADNNNTQTEPTPPQLTLGLDDDGAPQLVLGRDTLVADMASLLVQAPGLRNPAQAGVLARAANHLARGTDYAVIDDPAAFEARYRARLAREDAATEWRQGVLRLVDHGVPDFADIQAPLLAADGLVFCAEERLLGLPYRVTLAPLDGTPRYEPLRLTPVAPPAQRKPLPLQGTGLAAGDEGDMPAIDRGPSAATHSAADVDTADDTDPL